MSQLKIELSKYLSSTKNYYKTEEIYLYVINPLTCELNRIQCDSMWKNDIYFSFWHPSKLNKDNFYTLIFILILKCHNIYKQN